MIKRIFGLCILLPQLLHAQLPEKNYPQGYFRNPLAVPIQLAGNYGELRPNHFHAGIDIKTQQKENLPVYAAADGYVSRIGVSHTGYGNVLHITHPNGYTTTYGHLNRFFPALEQYVKQQQYAAESWATDIKIPADKFPVKKGDFVAWSGNTGASGGPHVHFEIRDTHSEKPLNPLLFGFDIPDTKAPEVFRIAIYDMDRSIYDQTPTILPVKKVNGEYVTATPLVKIRTALAGIGLNAVDRMSNVPNSYGIYEVVMFDRDVPNSGFQIDNIGFEESRYINAHTDYKVRKGGGPWLQLLFSIPGNKLEIYKDVQGDGTIDLSDGTPHPVRLLVKDAYGNSATVKFSLQQSGDATEPTKCANTMYAESRNIFENNQVEFFLDENSLYDRICFNYAEIPAGEKSKSYSSIFRLHTALVPLHSNFTLHIKPDRPIPAAQQHKVVMVREGLGETIVGATLEKGWYVGQFREFGNFHLEVDTIVPKIALLGVKSGANLSKAAKLSFAISDDSGIKAYRAELDGKWLMFARRGNVISYTFDEHCKPGKHSLRLLVTDIAGNTKEQTITFTR
jgi:murein DD-endopeptidase MepM/ murein hydrolase activator NlpD